MNYIYLDPTPEPDHNDLPHKILPPGGKSGEVRILKPADPEKLAKLHKHRRNIGDRRVAGGLEREQRKQYGRG